jgi:hypothetical protein
MSDDVIPGVPSDPTLEEDIRGSISRLADAERRIVVLEKAMRSGVLPAPTFEETFAASMRDVSREPITPAWRAIFNKPAPSDDDLLLMAMFEAECALLSTPPHCLPTEHGLPHDEDHANACAHRCWSFLRQLIARRGLSVS